MQLLRGAGTFARSSARRGDSALEVRGHRSCLTFSEMTDLPPAALDHLALEALFAGILAAIESAPGNVVALWTEFEAALLAHFEEEERVIVSEYLTARPREARTILEEHRYLRGRIAQLRGALPSVPLELARTFLDELRAHGQHEERVLYRWAETHVGGARNRKT
jgi:hypothetical protein